MRGNERPNELNVVLLQAEQLEPTEMRYRENNLPGRIAIDVDRLSAMPGQMAAAPFSMQHSGNLRAGDLAERAEDLRRRNRQKVLPERSHALQGAR